MYASVKWRASLAACAADDHHEACGWRTGALLILIATVLAQSPSATLTGTVVDTTGAGVPGAAVVLTDVTTGAQHHVTSSQDGSFVIAVLQPGDYVLRASMPGFVPAELPDFVIKVHDRILVRLVLAVAPIGEGVTVPRSHIESESRPGRYVVKVSRRGLQPAELRDIVPNVNDRFALRVALTVAGMREEVVVVSDAPRMNTSPGVSTVIDRKFVENLPLNGRSFQALLPLTPGVILTSASPSQEGGQFSVNGQRTADNYFTVDGVSANVAASTSSGGYPGAAASGQLLALTTTGGTNGLVSVDALQEFCIQTSGYAPEFGRAPGGQISLVTRSGTNVFHGSAFEYFRDDAMDATNWFVKRAGTKEAPFHPTQLRRCVGRPDSAQSDVFVRMV